MKNLLIFASGTKEDGGSGFQALVENTKTGILDARIVAVVSNHEHGGVRMRAWGFHLSIFQVHTLGVRIKKSF